VLLRLRIAHKLEMAVCFFDSVSLHIKTRELAKNYRAFGELLQQIFPSEFLL